MKTNKVTVGPARRHGGLWNRAPMSRSQKERKATMNLNLPMKQQTKTTEIAEQITCFNRFIACPTLYQHHPKGCHHL
jgi:hypothetical protein